MIINFDVFLRPDKPGDLNDSFAIIPLLKLELDLRALTSEQLTTTSRNSYIRRSILRELEEYDANGESIPKPSQIMQMVNTNTAQFEMSEYSTQTSIAVDFTQKNRSTACRKFYKPLFYILLGLENASDFIVGLASVVYAQSSFISDKKVNFAVGTTEITLGQIGQLIFTLCGPGAQTLDDLVEALDDGMHGLHKMLCVRSNKIKPSIRDEESSDNLGEEASLAENGKRSYCRLPSKTDAKKRMSQMLWLLIVLNFAFMDINKDITDVKGFNLLMTQYEDSFIPLPVIKIATWLSFALNQHNDPIAFVLMAVFGCKMIANYFDPKPALEAQIKRRKSVLTEDEAMLTEDTAFNPTSQTPGNSPLRQRLISPPPPSGLQNHGLLANKNKNVNAIGAAASATYSALEP